MRRIKLGVLLVAALFAVNALAAVAAHAEAPEFQNKNGVLPEKTGFKSSGGTSVLKSPSAGIEITCTSEKGAGKISGAKTVAKVTVSYEGCKGTASGTSCGTAQSGATAGLIKTEVLKGELGNTTEATTGVGQRLEPETGTTFVKIKFEKESISCLGSSVSGKIVGEATPINTLSKTGELVFTEVSGHQGIETLNAETGIHLTAFGFPSYLSGKETITFEEEVKVT